jgi:hypothetical protein
LQASTHIEVIPKKLPAAARRARACCPRSSADHGVAWLWPCPQPIRRPSSALYYEQHPRRPPPTPIGPDGARVRGQRVPNPSLGPACKTAPCAGWELLNRHGARCATRPVATGQVRKAKS